MCTYQKTNVIGVQHHSLFETCSMLCGLNEGEGKSRPAGAEQGKQNRGVWIFPAASLCFQRKKGRQLSYRLVTLDARFPTETDKISDVASGPLRHDHLTFMLSLPELRYAFNSNFKLSFSQYWINLNLVNLGTLHHSCSCILLGLRWGVLVTKFATCSNKICLSPLCL